MGVSRLIKYAAWALASAALANASLQIVPGATWTSVSSIHSTRAIPIYSKANETDYPAQHSRSHPSPRRRRNRSRRHILPNRRRQDQRHLLPTRQLLLLHRPRTMALRRSPFERHIKRRPRSPTGRRKTEGYIQLEHEEICPLYAY